VTSAGFCGAVKVQTKKGETPMTLNSHIEELRRKHAALEAKVEEAFSHPGASDQEITELKKKKLRLKEEIARLEAQES
jgi:hypothetical protein